MMKHASLYAFFLFMTFACGSGPEKSNNTAASDSALKEQYRLRVDSLKKKNPLLILPPDTEYTGEYLDKWENGLVKFRGQFRFGKRHGQWVSFYPNGEPWSELHYDKGNRHGPYLVYYPKMIKRIEGYYKNDMRDSIWNFYDSTGFKAAVIVYSKNKVVKSDYFKNPRFKRQLKIETKE